MSIHLRAIHDFPQDCNPHEADLLRRELAYYIYRRISRTRITVHLEGYSPTVPYVSGARILRPRLRRPHPTGTA